MIRIGAALVAAFACPTTAWASCNIADLLFGKVRVEMIVNNDPDNHFETGIIFGDDFDSKRFAYGRILGRIDAPERDGSRRVSNTEQDECGRIEDRLSIDIGGADCPQCSKAPLRLQKVGNGFAVLSAGRIVGTIEGHLPRIGRF